MKTILLSFFSLLSIAASAQPKLNASNIDEMVNAMIRDAGPLPKNLHCLFSGWTNLFPTEGGWNPYNLPETTVYAAEEDIRPEWTLCGGNCLDCAVHDGGCWAAKPGETIAFKIH